MCGLVEKGQFHSNKMRRQKVERKKKEQTSGNEENFFRLLQQKRLDEENNENKRNSVSAAAVEGTAADLNGSYNPAPRPRDSLLPQQPEADPGYQVAEMLSECQTLYESVRRTAV